jgi:NTP pyrophosphatase (non-canonical NTP hydrolase)
MNIDELTQAIALFHEDRDWKQFNTPKDLCASIAVEASELQELFLWRTANENKQLLTDDSFRQKVEDEMGDVFNAILIAAKYFDINIIEASRQKLQKNIVKYPVEKFKGRSEKYNELS